jgi:DNA-binding CsgD family transcriptional regulator
MRATTSGPPSTGPPGCGTWPTVARPYCQVPQQLSTDEAVAYARRGRGERKRPDSGWESLTPAEHDVVGLVCEGLGNKEVATRLFVSPRTVQAHLAHVYTKLGINSRVQLVQEVARRASASVD